MTKSEIPNCPACGHAETKEVLQAKDQLVSKEMFHVWECGNCTLRFTFPVPGESEIGSFYQSEEYVSHSNTSKGLVNKVYQSVRKRTLNAKRKLILKLTGKKSGSILDIGCGTGDFLGKLKESGWTATGIEPDPGARKLAIDNHGLNVQTPETLFDLPESGFDAITMWHVLEHVHRLHDYLEKIHQMLKQDGVFIIAVPNYTSHDAKVYKSGWAAYDVPRHLYHFSPKSMRILVEKFGFQIQGMRRMPFDSFYVSMLSEQHRNGGMIRAGWVGFWSWFKALGGAEKCSSIIYVVRKR